MTLDVQTPLLTTEDLLAMPDDGIDRELIRGQLREGEMTKRNPTHSYVEANATRILGVWMVSRLGPRGRVYCGEAAFRIRTNPDTTVGIDVAYVGPETAARTPKKAKLVEGPPVLAVEVLSPSDKQENILEKVEDYLAAGTKQVWLLETMFETVTVYRPGVPPILLSGGQELIGDPDLPGFRCDVAEFFA